MLRSDACSVLADREPLAGSAPYARAWLVVEHPGPWGRQALTDSGIPDAVVSHVSRAEADSPLRFLAARRIDHDRRVGQVASPRRIWLGYCDAERGETRSTIIDDLEEILDWDLVALTDGHFPIPGEHLREPVEFICTHSKRDSCCAVLGRERISSVPLELRSRVWECSHLGGHRFAATSLFLPSGRLYGRLSRFDDPFIGEMNEPDPHYLRGSSYLPPPLQAAERAVRIAAHIREAETVLVVQCGSTGRAVEAQVTAGNGRTWLVLCEAETFTSPPSCGAVEELRTIWRTRIIEGRN